MQVVRLEDGLPGDFDRLRAAAAAEGWRHMDRLSAEVAAGAPSSSPSSLCARVAASRGSAA